MKPIRKYATRDLEILSRRGNSHAQRELERRALIEGARASVKAMTAADTPLANQARFFATMPTGPRHKSPSRQRRDARRAEELAAVL